MRKQAMTFGILALLCLTLVSAILVESAKADQWNKETIVTFDQPVKVPGQVLPAGTYVFQVLNTRSNDRIVQIFNEDTTHLYTTILAIPDYRPEPAEKAVFTLEQRDGNSTLAVKEWFYPGRQYGLEFVYPDAAKIQLARVEPQPSPPSETTAPTQPAEPVDEIGEAVDKIPPATNAPLPSTEPPIMEEVTMSESEEMAINEPPMEDVEIDTMEGEGMMSQLPQTASSMPLLALLGIVALVAGLALMPLAKRRA